MTVFTSQNKTKKRKNKEPRGNERKGKGLREEKKGYSRKGGCQLPFFLMR